jgi:hypothetical protein
MREVIDGVEVESYRCEDYPCCGHGPPPLGDSGGCPIRFVDGTERYDCTQCGRLMKVGAHSAICDDCRDSYARMDPEEREYRWMMQERYDDEW